MTSAAAMTARRARRALATLLTRERTGILRRLRRRVGDQAEDLLQDTVLRALERLPQLADEQRLRPWFHRLLQRQVSSRLRSMPAATRPLAAATGWREPRALPAHLMPSPCACTFVALARLRSSYRDAIERADLRGEAPSDSARELEVNPNYARVRLHRARLALSRSLHALCGSCAREHGIDCDCRGP